jgi:hypothetical protein
MTVKLSDTQHAALIEVSKLGYTVAKANTIKSLENKGLIEATSNTHHKLTVEGREALGLDEVKVLPVYTDGYDLHTEQAEGFDTTPVSEIFKNVENADGEYLDLYNHKWADWERELGGFDATIGWKGTEVWDGLTAAEIKEDMETAYPVGRAARRVHHRTLRNAYRRMTVLRPRKSLKVTGAKGL